jgi:hypothetical protein
MANDVEEALAWAIKQADTPARSRPDRLGRTFVEAIAAGIHSDPERDPLARVPVPARFTERGEPPLVTIFLSRGAFRNVRVENGDARVVVEEMTTGRRQTKRRSRPDGSKDGKR